MTEDNFEEFIKKAAQGYNVPPARTPREDMWNAIQAQRAAGPRVVYGGGSPAGEPAIRRFGTKIWLGAAAAAMLLLATGVGIGRWTSSSNAPVSATASVPPVTPSSPDSMEPQPTGSVPQVAGTIPSVEPGVGGLERSATGARTRSGAEAIGANDGNGGIGANPSRVATGAPSGSNSSSNSAYQMTAVKHLSEAEALLTSFRTRSNTDQQMDAQFGSWARQLLNQTRLLMDSPVANDPQRRPLLEDLELVLVQIVQLSPGSTPQDREMIEKTLQQDQVMTRLRTAIPAGPQRGS
jgi:hypothetical protein